MNLSPEERAIEAKLAGLRTRNAGIAIETVLIEAGLRKARRQVWVWRVAAGVLLGMMPAVYFHRPAETKERAQPQPSVVVKENPPEIVKKPVPTMLPVMLTGDGYFAMRNRMVLTGSLEFPADRAGNDGSNLTRPIERSTAWELRQKMSGM